MKTSKLWVTGFAAFLLAAFVGGCKDENVERVGVCPLVIATNPANLATLVPLDQVITVTFNEPMNPATITPAAFTLTGPLGSGQVAAGRMSEANISGSLAYSASNNTMSFTPEPKLKSNSSYTCKVATTVKDMMGNALQVDYVWTFTTGDTISPAVVSTDPDNNETDVFLNKVVKATFNVPVDPSTITTSTFTLMQGTTSVAGTVSFSGSTASFKPSANLTASTIYTATITTGVKNTAGNSMTSDYTWNFTTGTIAAPQVISTDPGNHAGSIAFNKVIRAVFSEAMNPSTINPSTFILTTETTTVSGTVSYSGTTATFTPSANLMSGTTYTATITTEAMNSTGTPLANNYQWSFCTCSSLGPQTVDLKSVARFGIIAGAGVSNNAGFSEIHNMDVGISPGVRSSITGFPPAIIVNGAMYASDDIAPPGVAAMLSQAKQDLADAYLFAANATIPAPITVSGDQGGVTLAPGIYKSTSTLLIQSGNLTLNGQGDANAVWIFQIASDLTTVGGAGGNIILTGGAQARNVYWQIGSSATIGNGTSFKGNILALTSITMNANATAVGRMLARNGSVVMTSTNIIDKP